MQRDITKFSYNSERLPIYNQRFLSTVAMGGSWETPAGLSPKLSTSHGEHPQLPVSDACYLRHHDISLSS